MATGISPNEMLANLELSGEPLLDEQIKNWILWDKNTATLQQVMESVRAKDWDVLRSRLCRRIPLAISCFRAVMRAGFDSINDLVTIQLSQGLSQYLQALHPSVVKREAQGVVIGYDGRYNSTRFARLMAAVFLNANFRVYLFGRMVVSPCVSHAVVHLKCLAGIMVTGSHWSKTYNGFKIYWSNGAPVLQPHDQKIEEAILQRLEPLASSWDLSEINDNPLLIDPFREVSAAYQEIIKKSIPSQFLEENECSQLRFVYTALHGVGFQYIREAFYKLKLKPLIPVIGQKDPNPDFPTVLAPDPVECKDALTFAKRRAEDMHCVVILANDSDGDRLAVTELEPPRHWKTFTSNEMGALLGWWSLECYKVRTDRPNVGNCVMLSSHISSKILGSMARIEGFTYVETHAGYNWLANKALELQDLGRQVLFAYEQQGGFMCSPLVPDKDGINAACQLATMASNLRSTRRITLIEKLREIYDTYGYHAHLSGYINYKNTTELRALFERLRHYDDGLAGTYPTCILGGELQISAVRDFTLGLDTSAPDRKTVLPAMPDKQLLTFIFKNGASITLRESSLDVKLRFYAQIFGLPEQKQWDDFNDLLMRITKGVIIELIRPEEYKLHFGI